MEDNEPFFVLNSDVMCSFPFGELEKFHKAHGKEGTIMVMKMVTKFFVWVVVMQENVKYFALKLLNNK